MSEKKGAKTEANVLPLLPLKDIVIFPYMVVPLLVGREKSIKAIEASAGSENFLMLATQKSMEENNPEPDDIYSVGTKSKILQVARMPDGSAKILVEGISRKRIVFYYSEGRYFKVKVKDVAPKPKVTVRTKALMRSISDLFEQYLRLNPRIPPDIASLITEIDDPEKLVDTICAHTILKISEKQKLLEIGPLEKRIDRLANVLNSEIEILQIEKEISGRVRKQIEKSQKNYYLHEQLKAIEKELGKEEFYGSEIVRLKRKIKRVKMNKEAEEKALSELNKLARMPSFSPEATVSRNYIDWLIELPWSRETKDNLDIKNAERILNEDHYGLKDPKERVLEYLAVRKLARKMKGPILCFVGPPGVGKTSVAKSVARALGRKFVRVSLGGVRDEAEIRGHRRTYIGALPGRIIQSLRKVKSRNPVFLLDEIDKMSVDFRGDPSSALLEVLDPEQNHVFNDHYIEVDFDLSDVMFISTANVPYSIHPTLLDRMEIIRFPGYTEWEKLEIAKGFLIPKQLKENGLASKGIQFSTEAVLKIIRNYTREAGVRNLEREFSKICRKIAKKLASGRKERIFVGSKDLKKYLGNPKFRYRKLGEKAEAGVSTGLAWTEAGGDILKIETSIMDGRGKLMLTGQLGEVMRESAQAALSYIRSNQKRFKLADGFYKKKDIHVHVPEGQTPKDGPSAGVPILISVLSALTNKAVKSDVAMTGEITLRGNILPVGGIKEKVLAAHRSGIKTIILPEENKNDLEGIPRKIRKECRFVTIQKIDDVVKMVFEGSGK